jgi:hypothetical protein
MPNADIKLSGTTKPVIRLRSLSEMLEMAGMLRRFEDHLLEEVLDLPEGAVRSSKEKRLSIAKGVRTGIEWALGIQGKDLDQDVLGPEWEAWCREYKASGG